MVQKMVQCLLTLLEKWKRAIVDGEAFDALFSNLSKEFDCLDPELIIAKLNAYGFSLATVKLVYGYQWYRKKKTKTNFSHNFWSITRINFGSTFTQLLLIDLF